MLSGGARCRQTARHLATSPVTSLVLRAPAAPSPARRQPSPVSGLEASALRPSRPPPTEVGRVPEPLPGLPALGLGAPPASWPELLCVQMALRDRRTPLRWPSAGLVAGTPENQEPDCVQLGEGAVVQQQDLRERLTVGSRLGTGGATTSPTILAVAPGDQGLREGLCRRGTPCDPRGVWAGDSGSMTVCFAARPEPRTGTSLSGRYQPWSSRQGPSDRQRCFISTARHS